MRDYTLYYVLCLEPGGKYQRMCAKIVWIETCFRNENMKKKNKKNCAAAAVVVLIFREKKSKK